MTQASAAPTAQEQDRIFGREFLLLWSAAFWNFWTWYLMLPTMPLYVTRLLGGSEQDVGLLLTFSSIAGIAARPFAGRWVDQVGSRKVMLVGASAMVVMSFAHLVAGHLAVVFLLRTGIGISWGLFTVAAWSAIGSLAPPHRRAETMSYYSMSQTLAMSLGPAAGLALLGATSSFPLVFAATGLCAALVVLSAACVRPPHAGPAEPRPLQLVSPPAVRTSVVQACFVCTYAAVIGFLPLYLAGQGVQNPGLFFTLYAMVLLGARAVVGRISDRYGRSATVVPGLLLGSVGIYLMPYSTQPLLLVAVALSFGFAFAMIGPSLMALTVDRASVRERGAAMATFSASFDVGLSIGSVLWGFVAERVGFETMFSLAAIPPLVGLAVYLAWARPGVFSCPVRGEG